MASLSLDLFWNPQREDNFVASTAAGKQAARDSGYVFVRREAFLFPGSSPNVVPLKLYYNSAKTLGLISTDDAVKSFKFCNILIS
jgi:hypothetical protein